MVGLPINFVAFGCRMAHTGDLGKVVLLKPKSVHDNVD